MINEPRTLITQSNSIALGDSHTYGMGNDEKDCWPYLLNSVNCGVPGVSLDYIARNCDALIQQHKPEIVYLLRPHWARFEIKEKDYFAQVLPSDETCAHLYRNKSEADLRENHKNNLHKVKNICNKNNALLIALDFEDIHAIIDYPDRWPVAPTTLKNPKPHFGPQWHRWVADLFKVKLSFIQYIKNETTFDVI